MMKRINVYRYEDDDTITLEGWFDLYSARIFAEEDRWDGQNNISVATGSQWNHETLYRTKGGRWVLHSWSQWQGSKELYEFVTDDRAREWLIINSHDEAVAEFFGELEAERGPGRPEVGQPINVRLGDELLSKVDRLAATSGASRAETIRRLVSSAVG